MLLAIIIVLIAFFGTGVFFAVSTSKSCVTAVVSDRKMQVTSTDRWITIGLLSILMIVLIILLIVNRR